MINITDDYTYLVSYLYDHIGEERDVKTQVFEDFAKVHFPSEDPNEVTVLTSNIDEWVARFESYMNDTFTQVATETEFVIETSQGFWNKETQAFHLAVENGTRFNWLEQEDHLTEAMEEICDTKGAWFKVVCLTPFAK